MVVLPAVGGAKIKPKSRKKIYPCRDGAVGHPRLAPPRGKRHQGLHASASPPDWKVVAPCVRGECQRMQLPDLK